MSEHKCGCFWVGIFLGVMLLFAGVTHAMPYAGAGVDADMAKAEATFARFFDQPLPRSGVRYRVKRVVDGDTFWIDDGTQNGRKVRLIGVDTPEPRDVSKKKKHPMGKEVSAYVSRLLSSRSVRLELDVKKTDQYGRVLAYVFLEDGTHLNAHLLEKGYAWLMTVPPNVRYADSFYALQQRARRAGLGVWRYMGR